MMLRRRGRVFRVYRRVRRRDLLLRVLRGSDRHYDLALLFVGFHVPVGIDNSVQRKGAINQWF